MGLRAIELFAGVGGFRLGLEEAGHEVVWSNQWEPARRAQHASDCYVRRFGPDGHSNEDIATVPADEIPDHDLLVGGFPCQDYSVAATLDRSGGLDGKKGVLWWEIDRILQEKRPSYLLLENVDRLLRSPARQRGRDFGVLLGCLARLGYRVEWRVLNAADYGFPQRRRRVFIYGVHETTAEGERMAELAPTVDVLTKTGHFASRFPTVHDSVSVLDEKPPCATLARDVRKISAGFGHHFQNAGTMVDGKVWTRKVVPNPEPRQTLGSVLEEDVPEQFYIPDDLLPRWEYLKGAKREERTAKNGHRYLYTEGPVGFPDALDQPSRTLLTGEGGVGPSRMKHAIEDPETGRLRTLTPLECERLNGFPDHWTEGMPQSWRYFTMGNALVVGLVTRILSDAGRTMKKRKRKAIAVPAR